jgi:thioesterase domain-containing protein
MKKSLEQKPRTATIETLTRIWQGVLRRSSIQVEENFFDLGGDPWSAIELFRQIKEFCGRQLSPLAIYKTPTIASLAAALHRPDPPRIPALIQLKAGTEEPPVFLIHGLGSNVMEFFQLVNHIRSPHPIYGTQAKGTDGLEEPLDRIEDMAQFHLEEIKKLQPKGPYLLVGYSLGGLVALEMVRQLSGNGEKVALLAMLESYPTRGALSRGQRLRLFVQLLKYNLHNTLQQPIRQTISDLFRTPSPSSCIVSDPGQGPLSRPPVGVSFTPAMQRVRESAFLALTRYRPRFYNGRIRFVKAETSSRFPTDPTPVWKDLAGQLEVETVPGDHHGIISTHFVELAAVLTRYLEEAEPNVPEGDLNS